MKSKKLVSVLMMLTLILSQVFMSDVTCAAKIKLTKKQMTLQKGKTAVLKVKTQKPKAKWSIKSGKKCIRLSSRKKSSVKVKGIKKGTAKIQCKIGKKRWFCRVKVIDTPKTVEPTRTPQASAVPTTPTTEPTLTPCPTHIPTEDRLMAEPQKKMELPRAVTFICSLLTQMLSPMMLLGRWMSPRSKTAASWHGIQRKMKMEAKKF